jgi:hypothetical protein
MMVFVLVPAVVVLVPACGRKVDVQLQVHSFRTASGVQCRGWEACFEVTVKNVGTERGSGHCEVPYDGMSKQLYVRVKDLAAGAIYTQVSPRTLLDQVSHGPYTCDPGVRNATP